MHYVGNKLFDEDGNELPINEFWNIRSGGYWENDWEDYDEYKIHKVTKNIVTNVIKK